MSAHPRLLSVRIRGYRPFKDFEAQLGPVEVLVGANGAGKSSLFDFLRFLRDTARERSLPPEIVPGSIGQQIFHRPGPERFSWILSAATGRPLPIRYEGEVMGPIGRPQVSFERVTNVDEYRFMDFAGGRGVLQEPETELGPQEIAWPSNQLVLGTVTLPELATVYNLREYILGWRFYDSLNIAADKIRKSVLIEQNPVLREDAGNLSSVLHYLFTEHLPLFDELQQHLRSSIPGFKRLTVRARGGPGEVIAFWEEEGIDKELTLADLSDGILRLILWTVLCVQPNPPPLICIDEPDQGVHPRTLPILAGLFEKATERTQFLLTTHASYFLMQFDISRIAVMRKTGGEAVFLKPKDSKTLRDNLSDFGPEELEIMHRTDELERLA